MDTQKNREQIQDFLAHVIPRQPYPQYIDDAVFLEVKELLSQHPDKLLKSWGENPRLYTLLRMLGYHDDDTTVFQKFDTDKIGDYWLPVGPATLNQLSSSVGINPQDWHSAQLYVLSKPELMGEEKLLSEANAHRNIRSGSTHFEELEKIGKGGSAEVARVRHKLSGKQFACKRIIRADNVKAQRNQLIEFVQEVSVLQRISHHHTVSFVASFTDLVSFSLILNPVAKDVLKSVLERQSSEQPLPESDIITLRRSFGCLATALAYLHEKQVRHKDIKPGNILLSEGRVYLCDFGISRDFSQNENSTTEGDVLKFTQRYCAPEVSGREARNTKSDIWSLGCVFMEILSAIKGYGLEEVTNFFLEHSQGVRGQGLWRAPEAMSAWMVKLKSEKNDSADDVPLDWITPMVRAEPQDRLRASELVTMIHKQSAGLPYPGLFIGPCCSRADSIMPIDVAESPNLHPPVFDAFGIKNNSMSPPKTYNFGRPKRKSSPSSMDNRNNLPSSRDSATSRNRSISPRTQSLDPRDSMDTIPFPLDYVRSVGSKASQALRHTLPIFDSPRSSESFGTPRAEYASSPRGPQSPVPPPASFLVKCGCGRRPNEKHIFNASYTTDIPFEFDADIPTVVTCAKCEIGENRVQIYETPPQDPSSQVISPVPMLCWVTRRLVVSYLSGQPEMRHCSSFWVPLTDIKFVYSGNSVTLSWSDCNQVTERSSGNYGQHYDWIYKPKNPNNELTITFNDTTEAVRFVDVIRLPYEDGTTITRDRRVPSSNSSGIDIFDIGRPGVRNYRAAITEVQDLKISELSNDRAAENAGEPSSPDFMTISSIGSTSNLFIVWPELDLVMQNHEVHNDTHAQYQMVVEMRNVATPTYLSNIIDEPAADNDKVARFHKARPVKATMIVNFPYQAHIASRFPEPPSAVTSMLQGLTGWNLSYFAIVSKFKSKKKRFGSKTYGRSDTMLWEKEVTDTAGVKRRGAAVTFRIHEEGELIWVSGMITLSTKIETSSGSDATIMVSNKTSGKLLHVGRMTAIAEESPSGHKHSRSTSDAHEDYSDLVVSFENSKDRFEFVRHIEKYKRAAAAAAPLQRVTTSTDSMRRLNSRASLDDRKGPPMR